MFPLIDEAATSFELDSALDLDSEPYAADGEKHLGWQRLVSLQPAIRHRHADRLFDLAL